MTFTKKEPEDAFKVSKGLTQTCETLTKEKEEVLTETDELVDDQQNGWAVEKKKLKNIVFAEGFKSYAAGYLANDYHYYFTKFGE